MYRFTLTSEDHLEKAAKQGGIVVSNQKFDENGELVVDDDTAAKIEPALCRFYGAKKELIAEAAAPAEKAEPSLAKSQTK